MEAKAITYTNNGDVNTVLGETSFTVGPAQNCVTVKTLSTPVNPLDVAQVTGGYRGGNAVTLDGAQVYVPGNEGLYEVILSDSPLYEPGNWVIPKLPGLGTWRTHAQVLLASDPAPFIVIDKAIGFEAARTIMINPPTAVGLFSQFVQDWRLGDWLIQNAGNSQVSQFVAELAKANKVKVISVVRDGRGRMANQLEARGATVVVEELEFLSDDYPAKLAKIVGDAGVRLALDSLGGPTTTQMMRCLGERGQLVTYGQLGGQPVSYPGMVMLQKSLEAKLFWLTKQTFADPEWKVATVERCVELFREGVLTPGEVHEIHYDGDLLGAYKQAFASSGKHLVIF